MKSEVVSIMLNGCTTLIWLIPAAGIIKARKIDDRFFYPSVAISSTILATSIVRKNEW